MALYPDTLVCATSADIKTNQLQIVVHGEGKTTASFATGTAGTVLPAGTPLVYDGTDYEKFTAAASSEMTAIVWPNDVVLDDTDKATGVVLLKGEVRKFSEIKALVATADQAALLASCKDNAAKIGILVRGISNINQD